MDRVTPAPICLDNQAWWLYPRCEGGKVGCPLYPCFCQSLILAEAACLLGCQRKEPALTLSFWSNKASQVPLLHPVNQDKWPSENQQIGRENNTPEGFLPQTSQGTGPVIDVLPGPWPLERSYWLE